MGELFVEEEEPEEVIAGPAVNADGTVEVPPIDVAATAADAEGVAAPPAQVKLTEEEVMTASQTIPISVHIALMKVR